MSGAAGRAVLACVVAHNRAHLLEGVLRALVEQLDSRDVLVVDNASTDTTPDVVASFAGVRSFRLGENLGGAGGFAWAIELAVALGYDAVYLLDDDAVPAPGSIAALEAAVPTLLDREGFAFLVSEPVATSPEMEPVGQPVPAKSWRRHHLAAREGGIAVDYAAFLGILIDLRVAAAEPLPYTEFFIWCDDLEYTRRIALTRGAACIPASRIVHESKQMQAAGSARPLGWKFFYLVRNRLWLARWGLPRRDRGHRAASVIMAVRASWTELRASRLRPDVLRTASRAWSQGLLAPRPEPRPVGSLLAASAAGRAWVAEQSMTRS